ncbi:hypothetical protein NP233_g8021 [Leucocoprinus birnbaumii]|uniref:Uncharacterized protein n=1 Tax=Leucocoprinus birnbaumii TaxID=56174 RepID=A0AAD5VTK7_9AGAR|nr:hypothetical protein NP233_g8021 [Leucocoprinus birnbaumii]
MDAGGENAQDCQFGNDWLTNLIAVIVFVGMSSGYAPQLYRIIKKGSSEGFSPFFLLLGSTSAAAGFWNMITMQWGVARCCGSVSLGSCIEITAGIFQVFWQWFCFTAIFVLYILYYPERLKHEKNLSTDAAEPVKTKEWSLALVCSWVTFAHFVFSGTTTLYLMNTITPPPGPNSSLPDQVHLWATFLGVSSAILAAIQYAPQLIHTYQLKLVGALSIPMMFINAPGSVFMITGIALRPGTNWTSWFTFLVAGIMQAALLFMCIAWKFRQRRLGIDDFGNPLVFEVPVNMDSTEDERSPLVRK